MQWTGPHENNETDAVFAHVEWANTTGGVAAQAIMYYNAGTPFNADRRLSTGAINFLNKDLTGYRVGPTEWHASLLQPVPCGILNAPCTPSDNGWIAEQSQMPVQVQIYGRTEATAIMSSARQSGVALIPDETYPGRLRDMRVAEETLDQRDFSADSNWTYVAGGTDTWATTFAQAEYTYGNTGTGSLTQATADLLVPVLPHQLYTFEYQVTIENSMTGGTVTIPDTFALAAVTLPIATGFHRVIFETAEVPGDFVIAIAGAGAADNWAIDNLSLKLADDDSSKSHLIMAQTIEDWAPENILANGTMASAASWDFVLPVVGVSNDTWAIGAGVALYTFVDTGTGIMTQTVANRTIAGLPNRRYRLSYTGANAGGFNGVVSMPTGFSVSGVVLLNTSGRHITEFTSSATADTQDFVISISAAAVGTWSVDDILLELIEDDVRVIVRCM